MSPLAGETQIAQTLSIPSLKGWRRTVETYLQELRSYRDATDWGSALHGMLSLERGIRGFEGEIEWIRDAIDTIQS